MSNDAVKVIAITSGKGGVGKTNLAINLGVAFSEMNRRTVLLDANLGMANVTPFLGLDPLFTLKDVLSARRTVEQVMVEGPGGMKIVPAAMGLRDMANLSSIEHAGIIHAFNPLADQIDTLLIDTEAGVSNTSLNFLCAAQEVTIVMSDEPSSLVHTHALISLLSKTHNIPRFHIVVSNTHNIATAHTVFKRLNNACSRCLEASLHYIGAIPHDEQVTDSVQSNQPILMRSPESKPAAAIRSIAEKLDQLPAKYNPRGHLEFFFERLLSASGYR